MVTTTGNVVVDLLHNFHLECGARIHKLRVYETMTEPTGREVCGYLLVRGSVHAHAYALALKKITGVEIEKMLPTPNIDLDRSRSARSTWRRARTAGCTASARTTIRRWPAFGPMARWRCRAIRRASSRWWTGILKGADPRPDGRRPCLQPGVRARRDVRDRLQALSEFALGSVGGAPG